MAFTDVGYNGKTDEVSFQQSAFGRGAAKFYCFGEDDFKLSLAGFGGTVGVGTGVGYGITSTPDSPTPITFGSVSTGTRWDLVAIRRDSTPPTGGTTSIVVIPGGPSKGLPAEMRAEPGVVTDQPLWLVPVTAAGAGTPVDMRVWWNDGGLMATGADALLYMAELGTYIHVLSESLSYRRKKVGGVLKWVVENTGPIGETPVITAGTVSTLPAGSSATFTVTGTPESPVINLGLPQGVQGIPSAIATMKGTVANVAALPSSGNAKNDAYIVSSPAPAHLHFWTGTAWQDLGPFQGPKGDSGASNWDDIPDKPDTFAPIIGNTSTTAKAGNYQPTAADISDATTVGQSLLKATDAAAARATIGAGSVEVVKSPATARPAGVGTVIWAGYTTRPTAAIAGDIWLKVEA